MPHVELYHLCPDVHPTMNPDFLPFNLLVFNLFTPVGTVRSRGSSIPLVGSLLPQSVRFSYPASGRSVLLSQGPDDLF